MATPTQLAELEAWLEQLTATIRRLDPGTVAAVIAVYQSVEDWENPTETLAAALAASAAARAGQQTVAEAAAQWVSVAVSVLRGTPALEVLLGGRGYPRNADPFDVYSRPIFAYRDALAEGLSEELAQIKAFQRAEMLALTDNILARRDAAVVELRRAEVSHYRRVIRPELSETGVCGLCIAAATRVYTIEDLMPLHTRCKCEVIPIVGADDPGEQFNLADMKALYAGLDATRKEDLIRYRYGVDGSGELGPVLTPAPRDTGSFSEPTASSLGFEKQSAAWIRQQIAITEALKESAWRSSQLQRLRDRLAELDRLAA